MANQVPKACFRWKDASDPASPQGELSDRWKRLCTSSLFFSVSFIPMLKYSYLRLAGYPQEDIFTPFCGF
jgi:hypothetical protein